MLTRLPVANLLKALVAVTASCFVIPFARAELPSQGTLFVVHGTPRNCSSITQLDSALASHYEAFFAGWSEQDYLDALAWARTCADYGWHVPERPRIPLLQAQHDKVLGSRPAPLDGIVSAETMPRPVVIPDAAIQAQPVRSRLELPADGSPVIGINAITHAHLKDTLFDIARRYGLGYEEIIRANPKVDIWVPGEGTPILLPTRRILPPGPREGIVVNLPEHRLYYFPKPTNDSPAMVITYPVSIGKSGASTPLGTTYIKAKIEHPSWVPTASIRREHAERGDPLPAVIGPGPNNPIGDFKMRLGFGDGTYEIHGTNQPISVGMAATHGCIGMYPEDLASLYAMISIGTPVRFINVPVKVAWSAGSLVVEAHPAVDEQRAAPATLEQLAEVLRATVRDSRVAILWDRAREALRKADGVITTVSLQGP